MRQSPAVLAGASIRATKKARNVDVRAAFLESFQCMLTVSLELLENTVFAFASRGFLEYRWRSISKRPLSFHDCLFL
jgi:hypothetical protein